MNRLAILLWALLLPLPSLPAIAGAAQGPPSAAQPLDAPKATFHSSSSLVLVDVIALSAGSGLPDKTLKRDDFQVFDNGHSVSIQTFDTGRQTRPLALWFVVQCNMSGYEKQGSGLFAGHISLLEPALKYLDRLDTVAVAHWCDNGDSKLDLLPTNNVEEVSTALEKVLSPSPGAHPTDRPGELALQRTLQLIVSATRTSSPEPLPVLLFLYGDWSAMPRSEADHFIDELLETSAIAFGLRDRRSPHIWWWIPAEQKEISHYITTQTGGQYLEVTPETYAKGLEEILRQLHFRYELGFEPQTLDGKRHKLAVELAKASKNQHKGVRLRYREAYVPTAQGIR
jgi:hypothetical protein